MFKLEITNSSDVTFLVDAAQADPEISKKTE